MKRILLLVNPKARSGKNSCAELEKILQDAGHSVLVPRGEEAKTDFNDLIRKYQDEVDVVLVGGGDGSISYVLPALVETGLPLAICPLGTANLLAKSFNLSPDKKDILKTIDDGEVVTLDLGTVNGIYFVNVTGLGISTEVNQTLPKELKKKAGHFSFWLHGLRIINKMYPFRATITVNKEKTLKTRTWQITICNGKRYANWMTIHDEATYSDQTLHCLSTEVNKWWKALKLLPSYLYGKYKESQDLTIVAGQELKIETSKPRPVDVDGDVKTYTPAVFKIVPCALKIMTPD